MPLLDLKEAISSPEELRRKSALVQRWEPLADRIHPFSNREFYYLFADIGVTEEGQTLVWRTKVGVFGVPAIEYFRNRRLRVHGVKAIIFLAQTAIGNEIAALRAVKGIGQGRKGKEKFSILNPFTGENADLGNNDRRFLPHIILSNYKAAASS